MSNSARILAVLVAATAVLGCGESPSASPDAACTPKSCTDLGKMCGTWQDGCGREISCATCPDNQMCGVNGHCTADSNTVGPEGGTAQSDDGTVSLSVPAGALMDPVTFVFAKATKAPPSSFDQLFRIGPTGTTFAVPATVTIPYNATLLASAGNLITTSADGGSFEVLDSFEIASDASTISGQTSHLSPFYSTTLCTSSDDCAFGQACYQRSVDSNGSDIGQCGLAPGGGCGVATCGADQWCCDPTEDLCIDVAKPVGDNCQPIVE